MNILKTTYTMKSGSTEQRRSTIWKCHMRMTVITDFTIHNLGYTYRDNTGVTTYTKMSRLTFHQSHV